MQVHEERKHDVNTFKRMERNKKKRRVVNTIYNVRFAEHSVNIVLSTTLCDAGIDLSSIQHMTNQIMNTPVANYCLNYLVYARV